MLELYGVIWLCVLCIVWLCYELGLLFWQILVIQVYCLFDFMVVDVFLNMLLLEFLVLFLVGVILVICDGDLVLMELLVCNLYIVCYYGGVFGFVDVVQDVLMQ